MFSLPLQGRQRAEIGLGKPMVELGAVQLRRVGQDPC